ncbi:MAG TPA: Hsp20/alpha crystallin family protein [Parcubacteria group bacterium]|jgi:HSP20 family protein|nr:Hsp20/alpha crystallin family protein [Parcubacteria group bacterium]
MKDNRSFFERLTGSVRMDDMEDIEEETSTPNSKLPGKNSISSSVLEEPEEGELTIDVYQTPSEIVIKSMVAGVKPEDLDISITRDMVVIKGKRETERFVKDEDYFHQELYWGSFSRSIMLPAEVEVEEADAIEKHGLLIIRLPKIDKNKQTRLRVKG